MIYVNVDELTASLYCIVRYEADIAGSLKDPAGEQDAPLGRPNAFSDFVTVCLLTVYPKLTPGKQYYR